MLQAIFGGFRPYDPASRTGRNRLNNYMRHYRLYDGWQVRQNISTNFQYKRLKYNLIQPIVNIGVDFLAARDITFQCTKSEYNQEINQVWNEMGGTPAFIENAITGSVYGDACIILVDKTPTGLISDPNFVGAKWVSADICYPTFNNRDLNVIDKLVVTYWYSQPEGGQHTYMEVWENGQVVITVDGKQTDLQFYDERRWGGVPAIWIRNVQIKGQAFGRSDVEPIAELAEEYDHLCEKLTRIIDYYANPNVYVKGTRKPDTITKDERTIYYLPENGDMGFIEWKGTAPTVDIHINRVRQQIAEVSSTPLIALGLDEMARASRLSGVALKVLYGPLLAKTDRKRASWGPAICKALRMVMFARGVELEEGDIIPLWSDPLPSNTKEFWDIAAIKNLLGISMNQVQKEAGYTEQTIKDMEVQWQKEETAKAMTQTTAEPANIGQIQKEKSLTRGT